MSLIFSCFSSHSSFPFNVVVFDFMVLGDISFVMLISVWSYGFSFTYCCCCLIIYIFMYHVFWIMFFIPYIYVYYCYCHFGAYLLFIFLPFFVLVLNNEDEKWFFFYFLKKRGPAFWESAGVRELNNIILYHTSAFWVKRRYANIILFFLDFGSGVLPSYGRFSNRRCAAFPRHIYRRFAKTP